MNNILIFFCVGAVIGHFLFLLGLAFYDILLSNEDFKDFIEFLSNKL